MTQIETISLTPEMQEKVAVVARKIVDMLKAETSGPLEAYMILDLTIAGFRETYGIQGSMRHKEAAPEKQN